VKKDIAPKKVPGLKVKLVATPKKRVSTTSMRDCPTST